MIFIICDKTFATKKTVFYSEDTNEIIKKKEKKINETIIIKIIAKSIFRAVRANNKIKLHSKM